MLKAPPILILAAPTSALHTHTARAIQCARDRVSVPCAVGCGEATVGLRRIGTTGGTKSTGEQFSIPLADRRAAHENWLPGLMAR